MQPLGHPISVESKRQVAASVHTLRGSKPGQEIACQVSCCCLFALVLEPVSRKAQGEGNVTALAVSISGDRPPCAAQGLIRG